MLVICLVASFIRVCIYCQGASFFCVTSSFVLYIWLRKRRSTEGGKNFQLLPLLTFLDWCSGVSKCCRYLHGNCNEESAYKSGAPVRAVFFCVGSAYSAKVAPLCCFTFTSIGMYLCCGSENISFQLYTKCSIYTCACINHMFKY